MTLTFGIATVPGNDHQVSQVIDSIHALHIPNVEILMVSSLETTPIKKNRMARVATGDVLVLFHDYFLFDPVWYHAFEEFGYDWDVCSNPQIMQNGLRHPTDWVTWDSPVYPRYYSLPYEDWSHTMYMYQSGGYMLVKRKFFLEFPMNENYGPGTPEDVEWSLRIRAAARWVCNPKAIVRHNKVHRDSDNKVFPIYWGSK